MIDDTDIDWSTVKIVWHSDVPDITNVEQIIIEDCKKNLWGLASTSSLIFHLVFLGNDMHHDVVTLWGEEGNEDLHCEYDAKVTWTSLTHE